VRPVTVGSRRRPADKQGKLDKNGRDKKKQLEEAFQKVLEARKVRGRMFRARAAARLRVLSSALCVCGTGPPRPGGWLGDRLGQAQVRARRTLRRTAVARQALMGEA